MNVLDRKTVDYQIRFEGNEEWWEDIPVSYSAQANTLDEAYLLARVLITYHAAFLSILSVEEIRFSWRGSLQGYYVQEGVSP